MPQADMSGNAPRVINYAQPTDSKPKTDNLQLPNLQAEKDAAKAREDYEKETLEAHKRILKATEDADKTAFEKAQEALNEYYKKSSTTAEIFRDAYLKNEVTFVQRAKQLAVNASDFEAAREKNPKNPAVIKAARLELQNELNKIDDESAKRQAAIEKLITETVKKETTERAKLSEDDAKRQIESNKRTTDAKLSDLELSQKTSNDSQKKYLAERDNLIYQSLKFEQRVNEELLKNPALSAEKKSEITNRIKAIGFEISAAFNATTVRNVDSFNKALQTVDDIFRDLNLSAGGKGATTPLDDLNKLLADPEVTEAIKKRADALGYTVEQLKELLRVQTEGQADGANTRPRVVPEAQPETGTLDTIDNIFGEDSDSKVNKAIAQGQTLEGVFKSLSGTVQNAAKNMVQAFGSAIEGYILYGNSIGKALKQAAAAELAHISSTAAIKAIYQTAEGIAALFFNPGAAANHFAAAALYASIALGAGLAGRALAGSPKASNSFKQQTGANYDFRDKSSAPSSSDLNSGATGALTAFSKFGDKTKTVDEERTVQTAPPIKHDITLRLPAGMVERDVAESIRTRGRLHGLFIDLIEG